jgi:anti-anti-sigma factor
MGQDDTFQVEARHDQGRLIVVPAGELDIATVEPMREALAGRAPGEDVEIDLRGLSFLDTSGLQLIVEAHRQARDEGYELRILPGTDEVQRVFEIAGLERVLPFAFDGG